MVTMTLAQAAACSLDKTLPVYIRHTAHPVDDTPELCIDVVLKSMRVVHLMCTPAQWDEALAEAQAPAAELYEAWDNWQGTAMAALMASPPLVKMAKTCPSWKYFADGYVDISVILGEMIHTAEWPVRPLKAPRAATVASRPRSLEAGEL